MSSNNNIYGNIFDVQGFSVHDGPGARTLIFLNGCSMACKWCSNPEGRFFYPVPMYNASKCDHDGDCIKACPEKAISMVDSLLKIDRRKCKNCMGYLCAKACCSGALRIAGYKKSLEDVIKIIKRDRQYWGDNGGITLTGGEPFLRPGFVLELLKYCRENYIHTAVETCGDIPSLNYEKVLKYLDWIFFDIKHIDPEKHKNGTGVSNELILKNARTVADKFKGELIFRTVIIPDYNDTEYAMEKFAEFLLSLRRKNIRVNLLPLHHLGREKYNMLGQKYGMKDFNVPKPEMMKRLKKVFIKRDIECYLGSETPF